MLRGMTRIGSKEKSAQVIDDIRNFLVLDPENRETIFDLFALNVRRGRDHGLLAYNDLREEIGLPRLRTYRELTSDVNTS